MPAPEAPEAPEPPEAEPPIVVGLRPLTIEHVVRIAGSNGSIRVSDDAEYRERLRRGVAQLAGHVRSGRRIYGVTTGFGDSCDTDVGADEGRALALNLTRYHRCGTGRPFDDAETVAILVARLVSLARGYSAVRAEVLELLALFVNRRVLPRIPSEGSVGASGDSTPSPTSQPLSPARIACQRRCQTGRPKLNIMSIGLLQPLVGRLRRLYYWAALFAGLNVTIFSGKS